MRRLYSLHLLRAHTQGFTPYPDFRAFMRAHTAMLAKVSRLTLGR